MGEKCTNGMEAELKDTANSAEKKPRIKYQKENIYNKLLPYYEELDEESKVEFEKIKGNFARAVMLRELEPGCVYWADRLRSYITMYGNKFTKEDHLLLIKLLYELYTIPNLHELLMLKFGTSLHLLTRKQEQLSPDDLQLPWRPLYEMKRSMFNSKDVQMGICKSSEEAKSLLKCIIFNIKVYFPLNATQEILDEIRPKFYLMHLCSMKNHFQDLMWFLPTEVRPEHHLMGYRLWFEEFMTLWDLCRHSPTFESDIMWLMTSLARNNIGHIDWNPYVPAMFGKFLHCFHLPVAYKSMNHAKAESSMSIHAIAIWIVSTLGHNSTTQMYLTKFFKAVDSFLQPANSGRWQQKLRELIVKLAYYFVARLCKERYPKPSWKPRIPDSHKLTETDIDLFVESILPVAKTGMLTKCGILEFVKTLNYICCVRPKAVIPVVLDRLQYTLECVTEPHKLMASIAGLTSVVRVMAEGPRYRLKEYAHETSHEEIIPILFSILPGIDRNDTNKCFMTFRFIKVVATYIPFRDCTQNNVELSESDQLVRQQTSRFEDFVLEFLDKVFTLIESSSTQCTRNKFDYKFEKNINDLELDNTLYEPVYAILHQTSPEIFKSAVLRLRSFLIERIQEVNIGGLITCILCRAFLRVDAKTTLNILVPALSEMILDVFSEGDDITKTEQLDKVLGYGLLMLSNVAHARGDQTVEYAERIMNILDHMLTLESREARNMANILLEGFLESLSSSCPNKYTPIKKDLNSPDYCSIMDWGKPLDVKSVKGDWYMPGEKELAVLRKFLSRYLLPELAKLEQYSADPKTMSRDELVNCLATVNAFLLGSIDLLPMWQDDFDVVQSRVDLSPFTPTVGLNVIFTMPDGSNIRKRVGEVVSSVLKVFRDKSDVEPICLMFVSRIMSAVYLGKLLEYEQFEKKYEAQKKRRELMSNCLFDCKGNFCLNLMERAELKHLLRIHLQVLRPTKMHKQLIEDLIWLATCEYSDVRTEARNSTLRALYYSKFAIPYVLPRLLDVLKQDTKTHAEQFKGAFHFLCACREITATLLSSWERVEALLSAVILSEPSEDKTIVKAKENFQEFLRKISVTIPIKTELPESCINAASSILQSSPDLLKYKPNESEIESGVKALQALSEHNMSTYVNAREKFFRLLVEGNLHWRHRLMSMMFIRELVHPEVPHSPQMVRYFMNALVHDSLEERTIAARLVIHMLRQQKRKFIKISIDPPALPNKESSGMIRPGLRSDNACMQYDYSKRALSQKDWDEPRFFHRPHYGYYVWPKKVEIYAPSSQQPSFDSTRELTDHEKEVVAFFENADNIDKLVTFYSIERKKGEETFINPRYLLHKSFFRNHGIGYLQHFKSHLKKLIESKEESSHRCAAEILAGLVNGAKHWPYDMTCEMWDIVIPLLRTMICNVTYETLNIWGQAICKMQMNRDPNRQHWLFELLIETPIFQETESTKMEAFRIHFLEQVTKPQAWRLARYNERILMAIEDRVLQKKPFAHIVKHISPILTHICCTYFDYPGIPVNEFQMQVKNFLERLEPYLRCLLSDAALNDKMDVEDFTSSSTVEDNETSADNKEAESEKEREREEKQKAIQLLETICSWIVINSTAPNGLLPDFYKMLPYICQGTNYKWLEHLHKLCVMGLGALAQALVLPRDMPLVLNEIKQINSTTSSWMRVASLGFLEIFIFHNMSTILSNNVWIESIREIIFESLLDDRFEVREKAAQVLCGLFHCSIIPESSDILEKFEQQAATKIGKLKANNCLPEAIRKRHAGILGLCAVIQAHPYQLPKFIPPIFEILSPHMNDPEPIPMTIKKALNNFKRTHCNEWTGEAAYAKHFTEEQLEVLENLIVPPSHYA